MKPKYTMEVLSVIEKWVPDYSQRAALLVDLTATVAYKRNKSFRDTVDGLMTEYAQKRSLERENKLQNSVIVSVEDMK